MRSFIEDGYTYIWKERDDSYVVSESGEGSDGYRICRDDASSLYNYEEAVSYWRENPEKRYEYHEPEPTEQELIQREVSELKHYLDATDYAVIKCYDRGVNFADEYPELYIERQKARERINEIENSGSG